MRVQCNISVAFSPYYTVWWTSFILTEILTLVLYTVHVGLNYCVLFPWSLLSDSSLHASNLCDANLINEELLFHLLPTNTTLYSQCDECIHLCLILQYVVYNQLQILTI
jgi:hypothetical protein